MLRLQPAFRAAAIYGLLTAPFVDPVLASVSPLEHRAPHVNPTPSDPSPATITAVSECHLHGTVQYCQAGTTEFRISGSVTASSYTDCHNHDADTFCMAPTGEVQIIAAQAAPITPTPTQSAPAMSVTAVSDCHLHSSSLACMAGATEYYVHTTVTATQDIPPAFTGCHAHGSETFCVTPEGDDVEISLASEESGQDHEEEESGEQNCHFHAGVEHCTGHSGEEGQRNCSRVERDYNIRLRIGLLFVMLVTSSIGVFSPIIMSSFVSPKNVVFTILRQFGTGVIISTAFVHLYTHANLMFQNECLGELSYEATTAGILMAGIFLSFLVEYLGNRLIQWHEAKSPSASVESASQAHGHGHGHISVSTRTDLVNISVLEAGIIFHSLLIGLTLVVAGDSFFLTLFVVIVFHQMFEGLALGTRIAALGRPCPTTAPATLSHSHGHAIEAKTTTTTTTTTTAPPVAPADPSAEGKHTHDESNSTHTSAASSSSSSSSGSVLAGSHVPMRKKVGLAAAFALVTPLGMAIGIGALHNFNGNDPATVIAIGTLDALSAGILVWVGVVEMWAHDWMLGGELTRAGPLRTSLGLTALVAGMAIMSLLGKWA
ncbi:high-affinity Zn(2+) transporter zrt1 [Madurella fahalii]|uniref:High-affinity Zn(2+) transporter zrt1 n=1 Tax=Madurella fahalii TaxID=1157608 RepID=A0ABQ0FWL6_9PEZI